MAKIMPLRNSSFSGDFAGHLLVILLAELLRWLTTRHAHRWKCRSFSFLVGSAGSWRGEKNVSGRPFCAAQGWEDEVGTA